MKINLLIIAFLSVFLTTYPQSSDSIREKKDSTSPLEVHFDSTSHFSDFEPPPPRLNPNMVLIGAPDSIIRLEYKRGKCLVVLTDDSTGLIKGVYLSKIKYSHGSLKERKQGYCCQFDEQGRLVSITEYGRHKKKYRYDLNWDSEKKRYY